MIIAIGGGEIVSNETYEIDKFIVESAKKENPNFLFIPTASKDAEAYIETINDYFGSLGCKTDTLYLSNVEVKREELNKKIVGIESTIDDINTLLRNMGFLSFKIVSAEEKGYYLCRWW